MKRCDATSKHYSLSTLWQAALLESVEVKYQP